MYAANKLNVRLEISVLLSVLLHVIPLLFDMYSLNFLIFVNLVIFLHSFSHFVFGFLFYLLLVYVLQFCMHCAALSVASCKIIHNSFSAKPLIFRRFFG